MHTVHLSLCIMLLNRPKYSNTEGYHMPARMGNLAVWLFNLCHHCVCFVILTLIFANPPTKIIENNISQFTKERSLGTWEGWYYTITHFWSLIYQGTQSWLYPFLISKWTFKMDESCGSFCWSKKGSRGFFIPSSPLQLTQNMKIHGLACKYHNYQRGVEKSKLYT